MASNWVSKIFIYPSDDGKECVSATMPTGSGASVLVYNAAGPYLPIGFPKPTKVDDASEWMKELKAKGFTFEPTTLN